MDKKVALLVDPGGLALDLAHTLELENWDVLVYIAEAAQKDVGEGILNNPVLDSWGKFVKSVDMIIAADSNLGFAMESLRKKGFRVVGGTPSTDRLEDDRAFGIKIAESLRMKTPRWREFKKWQLADALKYAQKHPRLVFKPSHWDAPRWLTYVARDNVDMVRFLRYVLTSNIPQLGETFILQEFIPGVEMCTGAWFNGYQFIKPIFDNWEFKGSHGFDRGANIDMAAIGRYSGKSKLFNLTLKRLEPFLKANHYVGYVDLTAIIKDGEPYFLEFTTRFGYPTIQLMTELQREPMGDFLYRLAEGEVKTVKVMTRWACGLCVDTMPSPTECDLTHYKGIPIDFPDDMDHIHLGQVKRYDDQFVTAGTSGFVAFPVGHAIHCDMAIQRAYETMDQIYVPAKMYRTDITGIPGEDKLREWRYV